MTKKMVMFTIDSELLKVLDEQAVRHKQNGRSFDRSAVICAALDYYFRMRIGVTYILGRKKCSS